MESSFPRVLPRLDLSLVCLFMPLLMTFFQQLRRGFFLAALCSQHIVACFSFIVRAERWTSGGSTSKKLFETGDE